MCFGWVFVGDLFVVIGVFGVCVYYVISLVFSWYWCVLVVLLMYCVLVSVYFFIGCVRLVILVVYWLGCRLVL